MTTRRALIVGATGLVGGFCLQSLLDDDHYSEVIAFVNGNEGFVLQRRDYVFEVDPKELM